MADPWAVVSTDSQPHAEAADPWAVTSADVPQGTPGLSARKRSLPERFADNFEEGRRSSIFGASADALAAGLPGPTGEYNRAANHDAQDAYAQRSGTDPWYKAPGGIVGKAEAGLATLGGTLAGGIASPESWLGFDDGLVIDQGGKQLLKSAGKGAAKNFAVGAASDVPTQVLQNAAGTEDGFDPWRVATSGAANALIPLGLAGAAGATHAAAKVAGKAARAGVDIAERALSGETHVASRGVDAGGGIDPWAPVEAPEVGPTAAHQGPVAHLVTTEAARQNIAPSTALTIAKLESGLDANAANAKSSAGGLYQFTDATWRQMGGGDKADPVLNAQRGVALIKQNTDALAQTLGREPEPWEIYLAHQQGPSGAAALLRAGDKPAIAALREVGVSPKRAASSIVNNGGRPDISAADFADLWRQKYEKASGRPAYQANGFDNVPVQSLDDVPSTADGEGFTVDFADNAPQEPPAVGAALDAPAEPEAVAGGSLERRDNPGLSRVEPEAQNAHGQLWQRTPEELQQMLAGAQESDQQKLVRALGEDGAAEFKRLDRMRNSMDPQRSDEGSRLFDQRFGDLTPDQERLVYGIGETDLAPDAIKTVLDAHGDAVHGDSEDWLAYMAANAARRLRPEDLAAVPAGRGTPTAQAAFVRMRNAADALAASGVDANELPGRMVEALVSRGGWRPEQAAEVVGGFVQDLATMRRPRAKTNVEANPIPALPAPRRELTAQAPRDVTDDALDVLRRGGRVRNTDGPTLLDFLSQRGLRDNGGDLRAADLDAWHRARPGRRRIIREDGRSLDDAAVAAQEAGYFGERAATHGEDTRAQPSDLIAAVREELAGRPSYATDTSHTEALRQHVTDLDEILTHLELDPSAHSNAEIKRRIAAAFSEPEHVAAVSEERFAARPAKGGGKPEPREAMQRVTARIALDRLRTQLAADVARLERSFDGLKLDAHIRHDGVLTLDRIEVPQANRSHGIGTAVMERLASFADKHGLTMALSPSRAFGGSVARLREFYARHGFEPNTGSARDLSISESMLRQPGSADSGKRAAVDLSAYGQQLSPSRNIGGLRDAPRPRAIERGKGEAYAGATVSRLAEQLRKALGVPHRQGRMTLKGGAVGEFDPRSGVIRTKAVQELDVLAHEWTHALEVRAGPALKAALKAHAADLGKLAYPGANPKHIREEGFAEFGRWFITNPDHARKLSPKFYSAFEEALSKDSPEILRTVQDIQSAYKNLLGSASVDVAAGSIAYTGKSGPLTRFSEMLKQQGVGGVATDLADRAWAWFVDDLHPLNVAIRKLQDIYADNHAGKRPELHAANNPYALARLAREAYSAGQLDIMAGVVPHGGVDPEGASLSQALEKALGPKALGKWSEASLREFDAYLISRRMVHEWDRYDAGKIPNPPDKTDKGFHARVIADLDAEHPHWKDAAQLAYEWQNNLWRKRYEAGLITKAAHDGGLKDHPDYVPLMRDMSDKKSAAALNRPRGSMQHAGGVSQFKGSTRDVISPLSSMMREGYELNGLIKRNEILRALDDLAQAAGHGAGAIVERLPAHQIEALHVDALDALTKAAEAAGLSERDITSLTQAAETALGDETQATLFRHREFSPAKGEAVVFVWRDGKKTPLLLADGEFGQDMFTAITALNKDQRNALVDSMAGISGVLRTGVTLSPEFMARNIVRDQIATWINTDIGYVPGVHYVKGAIEQAREGTVARRYKAAGGMRGGLNTEALHRPFPRDDHEAMKQLQTLRQSGLRLRTFSPFQKNPLRALAAMTDLSEAGTRLGVMDLAYKKARRKGLSELEAVTEAAITSRDILDFSVHGSKMLSAARVLTFMNASIQGVAKAARVLTASGLDRPQLINIRRVLAPFGKGAPKTEAEKAALALAYKAWAKIAALSLMGGALRVLYADDPEYQEINDNLRATHWFFRAFGHWVGIPKPFEQGEPSNIVERLFEMTVLKDPTAKRRMLSDLGQTLVPPYQNPLVSAAFGVARNRDYNGRPIVPDEKRGTVDPEYQFSAYTSELGKRIGSALKVSPAVVDYVITTMGGSVGRYGLQASNIAAEHARGKPSTAVGPEDMFVARGFARDPARASVSQTEFWDRMAKTGGTFTQAEGTFRQLIKDGDNAKALAYLDRLSPDARAYVQDKVLSPGTLSRFHPMERARAASAVVGDVRTELRDGTLTTLNGSPIALTPQQRKQADTALSHLSMAELRNALITTGAEGWAQKSPIPTQTALDQLRAANPQLPAVLAQRMALAKVPPAAATERLWEATRQRFESAPNPARASVLMDAKRLATPDASQKIAVARDIRSRREAGGNIFRGASAGSAPDKSAGNIFATGR